MLLGLALFVSGIVFPPMAHYWMVHCDEFATTAQIAAHASIQHVASVIGVVIGFEVCVNAWCRRPIRQCGAMPEAGRDAVTD